MLISITFESEDDMHYHSEVMDVADNTTEEQLEIIVKRRLNDYFSYSYKILDKEAYETIR